MLRAAARDHFMTDEGPRSRSRAACRSGDRLSVQDAADAIELLRDRLLQLQNKYRRELHGRSAERPGSTTSAPSHIGG